MQLKGRKSGSVRLTSPLGVSLSAARSGRPAQPTWTTGSHELPHVPHSHRPGPRRASATRLSLHGHLLLRPPPSVPHTDAPAVPHASSSVWGSPTTTNPTPSSSEPPPKVRSPNPAAISSHPNTPCHFPHLGTCRPGDEAVFISSPHGHIGTAGMALNSGCLGCSITFFPFFFSLWGMHTTGNT